MKLRFTLFVGLLMISAVCMAGGWNVATGGNPARNGQQPVCGPTTVTERWSGGPYTAFAQQHITDGNIVVMARCQTPSDPLHGATIVACDITNGSVLWEMELPVDFPTTDGRSRVSGMRDGRVFATRSGSGSDGAHMYALDADTGAQLWQSEALINECATEGCSFASNGDLIVGNFSSVVRIDANDGSTVWSLNRIAPSSDGLQVAVFSHCGYTWEATAAGPRMLALDLDTGTVLYASDSEVGANVQQVGPFVGPDGTVFAPRTQNIPATDCLVCYDDTGAGFVERWRTELGYVPFASFGVGPDGSIYSYSQDDEVIRLDPSTGVVLHTSPPITNGINLFPRMAIDQAGIVFVTAGGGNGGYIYAFSPDLNLLWSEMIGNINLGGPALADDGTLLVGAGGTIFKAYSNDSYPPPQNLTAQVIDDTVELVWELPFRDITSCRIYRDGEFLDEVNGAATTYTDDTFPGGLSTLYWVTAVHDNLFESDPSNIVEVLGPPMLFVPTGLAAEVFDNDVMLTWDDAPPESEHEGWRVYRNGAAIAETSVPALADTNLDHGDYIYCVAAYYGAYQSGYSDEVEVSIMLDADDTAVPAPQAHLTAYPNPFNPTTTIAFSLAEPAHSTLCVYNIRGQRVATLLDEPLSAGEHSVTWQADGCASGVYLVRLTTSDGVRTARLALLK
ncbi:MAG: PQQ-binding-like beta-propeller repeat protein [Candidatus Cloacimonetes bacterium]|nr:PQQ-binding-like beta-propeller repeat protein [Candidatus Cloacimonadota bacterium]